MLASYPCYARLSATGSLGRPKSYEPLHSTVVALY
jgi:hypothetical protein